MQHTAYYVGLMSGTSADAVDVVVVDFSNGKFRLLGNHSSPLPHDIRTKIHSLATPSDNEIDRLGELDQQLGELFSQTINELLVQTQLKPRQIQAIGSHGQTIRHRPPHTVAYPFTLQIGDPNVIAQRTGITTVADFRRRDMAAGGHGAPLVPAFHHAAFHDTFVDRIVVNIGGMANITWLPKTGPVSGFDTGPGNVLMDAWILENLNKSYDSNGDWARSGKIDNALLAQLLAHPFFKRQPPKSTGREDFNLVWLKNEIAGHALAAADIQATLLALTAQSISAEIKNLVKKDGEAYVCGGGAYNTKLMDELRIQLPNLRVASTDALGIAPEWIEAIAFAWMAKQTINRRHANLRAVTGATAEVILGGVYFA